MKSDRFRSIRIDSIRIEEIAARFDSEAPVKRLWIVCCDMGTHLPACRICGGAFSGRQRVYCSPACSREWDVNHHWTAASREALRRAEFRCSACGAKEELSRLRAVSSLEVHHVVPLRGRYRVTTCMNHQQNLQVLCHDCHRAVTARQRNPAGADARDAQVALELKE